MEFLSRKTVTYWKYNKSTIINNSVIIIIVNKIYLSIKFIIINKNNIYWKHDFSILIFLIRISRKIFHLLQIKLFQ